MAWGGFGPSGSAAYERETTQELKWRAMPLNRLVIAARSSGQFAQVILLLVAGGQVDDAGGDGPAWSA